MRHPDGAHTHGSSFDWRAVAAVAVIGAVAAGGGASGLVSGLTDLLIWVGSVLGVAALVVSAFAFRAMRRSRGTDYIRSMHGPTQHELDLAEIRAERRLASDIRAMRRQVEAARLLGIPYAPGFMRFVPEGQWPVPDYSVQEPVVWTAEVIEG